MDTVILKFGGSSVADNIKLNVVAEKVIKIKKEVKNLVVVVSAQGKTTDNLIKEAQELSAIPEEREIDMLLSTGEQITAAKLSILLNRMGYKAISLTGWQAGIITNDIHRNAKIEQICTERIKKEFEEGKIVIVAGFQGIDENGNITTLGRGGSDTTAVALQAGLNADACYIFSDVDGIYSADPNMITIAKRLKELSFDEMQEIADSGAKVLHNRCVQIGKKFNCNIIAKSTFTDKGGTTICQKIESTEVKSIVKNDKLIEINLKNIEQIQFIDIYQDLLNYNIIVESFENKNEQIRFRVEKADINKVLELLERNYPNGVIIQRNIIKLSIVGYGITQDNTILNKVIENLKTHNIEIKDINLTQSKIEVIVTEIDNNVLEELHKELIKD
jgi:aspartate kinase